MPRLLRFAVVGHPVKQSASPAMHAAAFKALGMPHTYEAVECPGVAPLKAAVGLMRKGGIAGLNVTIPHKRAVLELVDEIDPSAESIGAANTLVRTDAGAVRALNTDVPALVEELSELSPRIGSAVIIGAGGAASAALAACQKLGVRVIGMTSRSWSSSEAMYDGEVPTAFRERGALTLLWPGVEIDEGASSKMSHALRLQWLDIAASADIVIQAASASAGEAAARVIPWDRISPTAVALDVVYVPRDTPFLRAARARGLRAEGGAGMLVRQGALAFEAWLGQRPPLDVLRRAVDAHVAALPT